MRVLAGPIHETFRLHDRQWSWACWTLLLAATLTFGCSSARFVSSRATPRSPLEEQLPVAATAGVQPSQRTQQVLRRYGLDGQLRAEPCQLLERLEHYFVQEPNAETNFALAELSYLAGKRVAARDPETALSFYSAAVAHAYQYLFDPRVAFQRNVYDPEFRGACNLYNTSLENMLRIVAHENALAPGRKHRMELAGRPIEVEIVCRSGGWHADEFQRFEFASDYEVHGLSNQYHTYGLGVPLIAVRRKRDPNLPGEKYYPDGLSFPVTAFLRVMPENDPAAAAAEGQAYHAVLELYDPLKTADITVADARVPLESDLTTPLAYFLDKPTSWSLPTVGLIRPDQGEELRGLYMVQPYQPDKIPVVMVHGIWSSPTTWMQMFNELRSSPELREHYQFWFYLYPTGQPFWVSAAEMRKDLAALREQIDPEHRQPALDQMVLVGHSMGGLVSKLQTLDSGNSYWQTVSQEPFQLVKATPTVRQELGDTYFFHPSSSIRRVITIGTPHRGSPVANTATRWAGRQMIALPKMLVEGSQAIYRDNPCAFANDSMLKVHTSIDSLAPDCPILKVMLNTPRPPWVKYHNIVGVVENDRLLESVAGKGDGIVPYASAHLDSVSSEIVVNADHLHVHQHPLAVRQVRRILLEHVAELQSFPRVPEPKVYPVSAPLIAPAGAGWPTTSGPRVPAPFEAH